MSDPRRQAVLESILYADDAAPADRLRAAAELRELESAADELIGLASS